MTRPTLRPATPSKAEMLALPEFEGLPAGRVFVPSSEDELAEAEARLLAHRFVGFDTEARPSFVATDNARGPDVVQFACEEAAYVFQLNRAQCLPVVARLLADARIVKVGFSLGNDQRQLQRALGVHARPLLDLDIVFHARGHVRTLGVKTAVALLFGRRLVKSKRITTSNWSARTLEPRQVLYAGNDAWAALQVLKALALPEDRLPVWQDGAPPVQPATPARRSGARRRRPLKNPSLKDTQ